MVKVHMFNIIDENIFLPNAYNSILFCDLKRKGNQEFGIFFIRNQRIIIFKLLQKQNLNISSSIKN